ncbi:MAG: trimethylamine methyltransferase family protein, partial [Anaerolineales bacterium]|nr:trimethylamine methyltransferase family protein [Anaerolineales bacterium]
MALNGFVRTFKPLEMLTEEQIEATHRAVLDVLENTGVKMQHPEALKLFEVNGAKVDYESEHVWIPPALVEDSLRRAPSSFRMRARDPENDLIVGGNTVYFVPFPGMQSLDLGTWEQRTVSRQEYYEGVTVLDALESVHAIENYTPYFGFEGVPQVMAIPEGVVAQIRNSSKCIFSIGRSQGCEKYIIQIANEIGMEVSSG